MRKIYFDYAATTPLDPAVRRAMAPYFDIRFGNAGSLHSFGQEAMAAVDLGREKIVKALNLDILKGFREIIFTGSATEANNLALRAAIEKFKIQNSKSEIPRIIVSAIEHESVLETARDLEKEGAELVILPVKKNGLVDLEFLKKNLTENTALVSVMFANNETGVIQPIAEISKIIKDFRGAKKFPLFHSDAVQAFQYLDCSPENLRVDLLTLSAHKICGPKGIGALYIRSGIFEKPLPIITGGGQEFGWRSGTENVPLIAGFGQAAEIALAIREKESARIRDLRDFFWQELKKIYSKAELNNSLNNNLPNILNVYFSGHLAEDLLIKADMVGVAVSAGSACSARATKISHILQAMGLPEKRIKSSLRFSFGRFTDRQEIKSGLAILKSEIF
ncbi:MAG: cysteine desulfurase family protein [bacterium]|nr:cysteine desulfurase family protein [bacterium]